MRKILLSFLFAFCSVFAFSAAPKWLTDISSDFPSEKYIRAVGDGKSKDAAKNSALAELGAYFSQTVETNVKATQFLFSQTGKSSKSKSGSSESISRQIITSSISNLFSVYYTDFYYNKKQKAYSVCAYIPREEAWSILEPKLEILGNSFLSGLEKSKNQTELKKVIHLNGALSATEDFEALYYAALSVFPKRCGRYTETMEKRQGAAQESARLKREIKIKTTVSGEKSGRIKSKLEALLAENNFTVTQSGENHRLHADVALAENAANGIYAIYPQIAVTIFHAGETVSSFSKSLEKVSAYNAETAERVALFRIEEALETEFVDACLR